MPNPDVTSYRYPALSLSDDTDSFITSFDIRKVVLTSIQDDDELPVLQRLRLDRRNAFTKEPSTTEAGDHHTHIGHARPHRGLLAGPAGPAVVSRWYFKRRGVLAPFLFGETPARVSLWARLA